MRARETGALPRLNAEAGQDRGTNGDVMLGCANRVWDTTGHPRSGVSVLGIAAWDDPVNPVFAEIAPMPAGLETWASLYLAINKHPERGHFTYGTGSGPGRLN